jgi:hypothetical protein
MKKALLITIGLLFVAAPAVAFHDGGVAHCNGCHTMHNSQDGALVDPNSPNGNAYLLVKADPSTVCIDCHDHLDRTFPIGGDPLTPPAQREGGNFIFLIEDNLNDGHGGAGNPIPGDAAGHNLVATEHGLAADATLTSAPGGTFPASVMACTSCHDPHGSTDFRFLYGVGRGPAGQTPFTNPAPDATGVTIFAGVSSTFHTAYRGGMSAWCGNCHGDFHNNNTKLIHPSGSTLGGTIANTYNLYNGSDDLTGGAAATAYIMEVPFEDPANTNFSTAGPSASSQVSCITCHRAHASSAPDAGRWDFSVTFLHEDGLESGSYAIPNPYGYSQRSLCNKCHKKDEFDEVVVAPTP